MKTATFDYHLLKKFIAQRPASPRDSSKLLVYSKSTLRVEHRKFSDLPNLLQPGDVLVLNESKVIPARLETREGREVFLAKEIKSPPTPLYKRGEKNVWECLVRGGKYFQIGSTFEIAESFTGDVLEILENGERVIRFHSKNFTKDLEKFGATPLPPYIHSPAKKVPQYQTIYAKKSGSVAAPTAGLHFTPRIFKKLKRRGVQVEKITLHVGLGTFAPVKAEKIEDHNMHSEFFTLSEKVAKRLNSYKKEDRRIIAVGSTSCRVLESCADAHGKLHAKTGETDIFIFPGCKFKFIDAMLTNFHLPKSTLIMLVAAFVGREKILELYEIAKKENYRFFSFGDTMLLL
ncbi:tRNA preQ1(34) S-adenosylmethionine ribosyltransferase-isomerase QueA [Patescibacteria group bacterium]|nr:tRNA preQ1(34) S-adenosylmethionine ribosyltransferase-isomerase QueA [Patescibacteria group bacterium]